MYNKVYVLPSKPQTNTQENISVSSRVSFCLLCFRNDAIQIHGKTYIYTHYQKLGSYNSCFHV